MAAAPDDVVARPGLLGSLRSRERLTAYLCLAPWVLGFVAFIAGPMILSLVVSMTDYNLLTPGKTHWVGTANYQNALNDHVLGKSVMVTLLYALLVVPSDLVVGLVLALILNTRVRGIGAFRTAFFMPVMIAGGGGASVAIALLWLWIFQPRFGLLNFLLSIVHLPPQLWIYSENLVVPSLAMMSLWTVGRTMLIYLAGLQGLPAEVLWAAEVDGAGPWRRFTKVTLPLISATLLFNLVLDLIGALQTFNQAYLVTQGGPGNASLFYMLYLYRNAFSYFHMGYASALAWFLLIATLLLTAVVFRTARRWVYYQGDSRS